jgi:hypothetical protein
VKLADRNLQNRVTQKHVTSIGVREFPLSLLLRERRRIENVTLYLSSILCDCKMCYPFLEVECAAVKEKYHDLGQNYPSSTYRRLT